MNILVTGGAGFIGSHVVDAYINAGHDVVVVDDLSSGSIKNVHPKAHFYQLDIRSDQLGTVFDRHPIEVVNHHAAQMDVRRSVADPIFDASVNVLGSLNVFECARKRKVRKVIFASTGGAIYGEQESFPAGEEHPVRPLSPYGITKLAAEKYLYFYEQVYGIDCIVLRYANIYGPRQNPHGEAGVVAIFACKLQKGEQPIINGDGKQTRDYTYVGDVVTANTLALSLDRSDVFNVGTGVEADVNHVFQVLRQHFNSDCPERHGPPKEGEQRRSVISFRKIQKDLGWTPTISLDEGLRLTGDYFKQNVERIQ